MAAIRPTPEPQAALLFDVDGTLLDTGGAGRRAFERALSAWRGVPLNFDHYDPSGRTDLEILREMARRSGAPAPDASTTRGIFDAYVTALAEELIRGPSGETCPGVPELLAALAADSRWVIGLLTGNVARGAALKMRHYGLFRFFERSAPPLAGETPGPELWGAFGDDAEDRGSLVPIALSRFRSTHGLALSPSRTIVIGDTERDIRCARAGKALVLAVATGRRDAASLAAAGPDAWLTDFRDRPRTVRTLQDLAGFDS